MPVSHPRSGYLRLLAVAVAVLLAGCTTHHLLVGPSYGAAGRPYLAPETAVRAAARIDEEHGPVRRLILIGDAGEPLPDDPTLALLGVWGDAYAARTTVLFLGDNVYPAGLEEGDRRRGESILRQQIEATRAAKIFLPGNHDWGFSALAMMQKGRLLAEQRFLDAHAEQGATFLPRDGCPGPVTRTLLQPGDQLAGGLIVIFVDFHWWLLPDEERPVCKGIADTDAFLRRLTQQLEVHAGQNVIVAAHHPLRSGGPHGGLTRGFWTDLGASVFYRLSGELEDLWEPGYAEMVQVVSAALSENPPLAFVAGHDHGLQLIDGGDVARLLVVSGAGSRDRITNVTAIDGTLFAHAHTGFVVLDFLAEEGRSDAVLFRVVETGEKKPVYTLGMRLAASPLRAGAQPTKAQGPTGSPGSARPR